MKSAQQTSEVKASSVSWEHTPQASYWSVKLETPLKHSTKLVAKDAAASTANKSILNVMKSKRLSGDFMHS